VFNNELFALDMSQKKNWVRLTYTGQAPSPRAQHTATLVGNSVVVCGGFNESWMLNDMYLLDLSTLQWVRLDPRGQLDPRAVSPPPQVGLEAVPFRLYPAQHTATLLWENQAKNSAALLLSGFCASRNFPEKHNYQYVLLVDIGAHIAQLLPAKFASPLPARNAHTIIADLPTNRLMVFGGRTANTTEGGMLLVAFETE